MNSRTNTSYDNRIETLARRAGVERSLYLGDAIGEGLMIAAEGFSAIGRWFKLRPTTQLKSKA